MKVQLIRNDEQFELIPEGFADTRIFYKRITATAWNAISKKHTVKGELNAVPAFIEVAQKYINKWSGFVDDKGKEIPFSAELCEWIPDAILFELVKVVRGVEEDSVIEQEKK